MTVYVPSQKQLREFGLLIGFSFPLLIGWLLPSVFGHGFRTWTLWVAIPSLILGLTAPGLLRQPYKAWMTMSQALGLVNSHIVLGLVFLVILQPIAYMMRMLGHDPLRRKRQRSKSYRERRKNLQVDFTRIF